MKCHYEVLNLQRNADDSEIKTAYRKSALKWHPDKNLDDPDAAKEQFQLVQAAYEVLSDAQERAWYDNHREQILRGGRSDYEDNALDVFQYFTTSCYKGFGDDPNGFYAVYADVFRKIATEDIEYMESEEDFDKIPMFGDINSSYEEVVGPFYGYWMSYCTKKSYAWLNPHNIAEIRDRRVLKVIEKESKKIQQKAKKDRNEEIRSLVSFVRKRDKRFLAQKKLLEDRANANRVMAEKKRVEQILKRKQELEEECKKQPNGFDTVYEKQLRQLEGAYAGSSEEEYTTDDDEEEGEATAVEALEEGVGDIKVNEDEEEMYIDELYCVACNKSFKNQSSFQNHESSKKHRDNIEKLKREMQEEDESFEVNGEEDSDAEEDVEVEEISQKSRSKNKKKNKAKKQQDQHSDVDDEAELPSPLERVSESDKAAWTTDNKKTKKSKAKSNKQKDKQPKTEPTVTTLDGDEEEDVDLKPTTTRPVKKTKKQKVLNESLSVENGIDITHTCVTCHATFESKNKLFAHLKKMSHGVYIPKAGTATAPVVEAATATTGGRSGKKKK